MTVLINKHQVPQRVIRGTQSLIRHPENHQGSDRIVLGQIQDELVQAKGKMTKILPGNRPNTTTVLLTEVNLSLWDLRHLTDDCKSVIPVDHLWQLDIQDADIDGSIKIGDSITLIGTIQKYKRMNRSWSYNIIPIGSTAIGNVIVHRLIALYNDCIEPEGKSLYSIASKSFNKLREIIKRGYTFNAEGKKSIIDQHGHPLKTWNKEINYIERKILKTVKDGDLEALSKLVDICVYSIEKLMK